ncbi:hypothetical protein E6W36_06195 [Hankyongella ginsenosidimutans]|uniref:Rieske domain-containing protein n=1 Tax=Hankyongella ginsenosidimutans TaxID=1763828 RepID=A0A4D7C8G0_9SPHN|nr:hypothetical protein E6W36_06195 [Hankyongella ginsenosidimutans]
MSLKSGLSPSSEPPNERHHAGVFPRKDIHDALWLDIGPVEQLPALGARTLPVAGGREIAIFRTATGEVYALINECPHRKGPLSEGIVHDTTVTCPLHNWRISSRPGWRRVKTAAACR